MEFKNFLFDNLDRDIKLKKKIFYFVRKNLKNSIFNLFSFNEFNEIYFDNNKNFIFLNFVDDEINCLLTYLNKKNENHLRKQFMKFLIRNPLKFILFILNPINLFKDIKPPENFLQLFHFVNLNLKSIDKKIKYDSINHIHKNVINNRYKGIFVIYKNTNDRAKRYYQNNKFEIYKKNLFYSLAFKKF